MSAVACRHYDGSSSAGREAWLTITADREVVVRFDDMDVDGGEERVRHALSEVRIPGRVADTPRHVRLPDGAICDVRDNDVLDAMLAAAERKPPALGRRIESIVHRLDSSWKGAAAALAVTAAVLFSFTEWGAPLVAEVVVAATPPEVEAVFGANLVTALTQTGFLPPSDLPQDRRNELLAEFEAIRAWAGVEVSDLRFHSGKRLGANAFALPGGTVVITDELVALADNDEEIVAVLAHELGHVAGRHVMRRLAQTSSMLVVWTALTGDVSVAALSFLAPDQLLAMRYSRTFERDADRFAFDYLAHVDTPPSRLSDILRRLEDASGAAGIPSWLSSHPGADERAAAGSAAGDGHGGQGASGE